MAFHETADELILEECPSFLHFEMASCYAKQRISFLHETLPQNSMTDQKTLGQTIADARKHLKLSQKDLAEKILREDKDGSITPQYLNDIEHDRRVPTSFLIGHFAAILKIDADYLHFLAGRVPDDLRTLTVDHKQFAASMVAFRRSLSTGKKSK